MIEKILVMRREDAKYIASKKDVVGLAVISINSEKKDIIFTDEIQKQLNCYDVLNLVFADLSENDFKISPSLTSKFSSFNKKRRRVLYTS